MSAISHPGLESDPFPTRPVPDVFFASSVHRGAWGFLRQSLQSGEPFIMVSGAFGTGKTLLCLKLLRSIAARGLGPCVYLSTPAQGYGDMLRRAHEAVGLPTPAADADIGALTEGLYAHFRAGREARRRLFLLIEDPQDCDAATLHRLRLLPNFNIDGWYPVCVLFFAHTSFPALLREARWAPLDQRIKLRYRLTGLEPGETREYIYYRLLKARGRAGGPAPVFSEDAIARLHGLARGIPRAINALAGTCLSLAGARNQTRIDAAIVAAAAKWLGRDRIAAAEDAPTEADEDARQPPSERHKRVTEYPNASHGHILWDSLAEPDHRSHRTPSRGLSQIIEVAASLLIAAVSLYLLQTMPANVEQTPPERYYMTATQAQQPVGAPPPLRLDAAMRADLMAESPAVVGAPR